jgi:hypothetical protein
VPSSNMSERTNDAGHGRYKLLFALAGRWNVVRFLSCGGTMLVILGLAGVLGLLGSLSRASLFIHRTGSIGFISCLASSYW